MVVLAPAINALVSASSTGLSFRVGFILILAGQLALLNQYAWNQDFLTRLLPTYKPYPAASFFSGKYWIIVPNNACMKTKYFDPARPLVSRMEYDYIVVGSGPGGSTVANRLSEDSTKTVLLVEAGQDPLIDSAVPQFFPFMLQNSRAFNYTGEVVNSSSNAFRSGTDLTAGMMLGGSSGTNAMLYVCGTDFDYNSWAAAGNTGWDYNSILPFIKKSEDNTDAATVLYKDGMYHGTGGPLTISKYGSTDSYIQVLKDAFNQTGYKFLRDFNAQEYNGLVELQGTLKGSERCSAARAFLLPYKSRPNLTVMKGSMVEKVLFSGTKAVGVNVVTKNSDCLNIKLYARNEVVIAAGALGSPKILLKSGIGRAADLTPFGIPQVKNLAVGENFQDHVKSVHFIKINPNASAQSLLDIAEHASEYLGSRTGPLSNLNIVNYNGFINTLDPEAKYPDAHYIFYRFAKSQEFLTTILKNFGYKDSFISQLNATNSDYEIIMVYNHLPNPTSKGTVKLRSNSTWDYPKTVTNFLSSTVDVNTLLRGIVKIEELVETPAFQKDFAELVKFDIPECNSLAYPSEAYRKCYIKYFTTSGWHQSGTCKMGPASDSEAVVDERLRVHGIEGLRVIDASIMPNVVTTNTQCAVYMIGEKGAQMIIEDNE